MSLPTAVHDFGDAHDTAAKLPPLAPVRLAVRCVDQLLPSHDHADAPFPTATHALCDGHDTPTKPPPYPTPPGIRWIDQFVPFQRSASRPAEYGPW